VNKVQRLCLLIGQVRFAHSHDDEGDDREQSNTKDVYTASRSVMMMKHDDSNEQ